MASWCPQVFGRVMVAQPTSLHPDTKRFLP
jgi:hypothetical protein